MVKGRLLTIFKVLGGLFAFCIALIAGTVLLLNTDAFQNKLLKYATQMLSEKLQTHVEIDSISVGLFSQDVNLYGLDVEDLQHRKMLQLDRLSVDLKLMALLHNEVCIKDATIDGVRAQLYKPRRDSAANYQFVIDAFKKDSTKLRDTEEKTEKKGKKKLTLNLSQLSLSHIDVTFNDQVYTLQNLMYQKGRGDRQTATIMGLQRSWVSHPKKGPLDNMLHIGSLMIVDVNGRRSAEIDSLHFVTNNHLPRKNSGKPKRGAFDVGHFDIVANLKLNIDSIQGDSIAATITQCSALDKGSGLTLKSLKAKVLFSKGVAHLGNVDIQMPNTQLKFAKGTLQLPSKKLERPLKFSASSIAGRVVLKDIARPFAPVLSGFTLPLSLRVDFSGDAEELKFRNVSVSTLDKKLTISAYGGITGLKDKYKLNVHFHVNKMTALGGIKERIISQFPVKKFMMKQLHNLGNTEAGSLNFNFALDELNKYVSGTAKTDAFLLGKVMEMPDLGSIACKADFKFDISKPRTAIMRRKKGGKLPIGEVSTEVYEVGYKKIKLRNIEAKILSDGAVAEGNLTVKGSRVDVLCNFSFTNTNEMRKMKVVPGIRFHKLSEEDKAAKEEKKAAKRAAKEERKQKKAEEKAIKKAAKEEERAAKKAAKEEERAAKKAAKEEKRAAKKAEREARKAAKEQN